MALDVFDKIEGEDQVEGFVLKREAHDVAANKVLDSAGVREREG